MKAILRSTEIVAAQERLDSELKQLLPHQGPHKLGFRGGGKTLDLHSRGRGELYYASIFLKGPETTPRFWNAFGFYDGLTHGSQRIAVEINIPNPADRRVAGFFAKDTQAGEILLLHDGKIGGGKEGVCRGAFLDHSRLRIISVASNGRSREAVVVAKLGDPNIVHRITSFANAVAEFKASLD